MDFKDEVQGHYARKIQLNQVPEIVKRMIQKDPNVIDRLKNETFTLVQDKRIWTFPRFKPLGAIIDMTNDLLAQEGNERGAGNHYRFTFTT